MPTLEQRRECSINLSAYSIPGIVNNRTTITPKEVLLAVCCFFGIEEKVLLKLKSRKRELVFKRFITMYLLEKKTSLRLVDIGKMFGNHYSTVINGRDVIKGFIDIKDEKTIYSLSEISKLIKYRK